MTTGSDIDTSFVTETNLLVDVRPVGNGKLLLVIDEEAFPLTEKDATAIAQILARLGKGS